MKETSFLPNHFLTTFLKTVINAFKLKVNFLFKNLGNDKESLLDFYRFVGVDPLDGEIDDRLNGCAQVSPFGGCHLTDYLLAPRLLN